MHRIREIAVGSLLAAGLLVGCAPSEEEAEFLARKAVLQRQNQGIRELIAEEEGGSLVPTDRFLVGVDEQVVGDLLNSQLPLERPLGKRFIIRLERATVLLRDKYGLVTIEGEIHLRATPNRHTAVRILGGLGAVQIDPETDLLSMRIAIDRIEVLEAGRLEKVLGRSGKKFISEQGRPMLQEALPNIQLPVALARNIRVPAIREGAIQLDSLLIPLDMSVERAIAAGGKMWLTLQAEVGDVTGGEGGLGVAVKRKARKTGATSPAETSRRAPADSAKGGGQ
jgi:hypothetical protein